MDVECRDTEWGWLLRAVSLSYPDLESDSIVDCRLSTGEYEGQVSGNCADVL